MEEWKIIVLTALCSLFASIVTAVLSSSMGYKNEIKKQIREKRAELYFTLYDKIELVLQNHYKVFDKEYFDGLTKFKPKMELLASPKTFDAYLKYYEYVGDKIQAFKSFYKQHDPEEIVIEPDEDEYGNEYESVFPKYNEYEKEQLRAKIEKYKNDNLPTVNSINSYIEPLYNAMRCDLGSNL